MDHSLSSPAPLLQEPSLLRQATGNQAALDYYFVNLLMFMTFHLCSLL